MNLRKVLPIFAIIVIFVGFVMMVMRHNMAGEMAFFMLMAVLFILMRLTRTHARK